MLIKCCLLALFARIFFHSEFHIISKCYSYSNLSSSLSLMCHVLCRTHSVAIKDNNYFTILFNNIIHVHCTYLFISGSSCPRYTLVKSSDNIEETFRYELCSYPPALFDSLLFLREPQKPVLVNSIWEKVTRSPPVISRDIKYVLDGGSLLHC